MNEHLPECPKHDDRYSMARCICKQLRACEQRVREDEFSYKGDIDTAYGQGWDEALDAAREAVVPQNVRSAYLVSLSPQEQRIAVSALELAARAIDALREERK